MTIFDIREDISPLERVKNKSFSLSSQISLTCEKESTYNVTTMGKYFGTDGIRGLYGKFLTDELSYKAGLATGFSLGKGTYLIGCDTRVSCPPLLLAYCKGLADIGCDAVYLGILPTPAVSALTIKRKAKCGVMISASHNPPEYNGIKIFGPEGVKLTGEQEENIERVMDDLPKLTGGGKVTEDASAADEYIEYICNLFKGVDFKGVEAALDCANGASGNVAPRIFERLGFRVNAIHCDTNDGARINEKCGALHPETVMAHIKTESVGLSFDGDADRLSIVYKGEIMDGDSVIYNLSKAMPLKNNTVVATILNNLSLENALKKDGVKLIRTAVGDKYIADEMFQKGYSLGGEQSGHYIIRECGATGDGIAAALFFIKSMLDGKGGLKQPVKLDLCPQGAIAEYAGPSILNDSGFIALKKEAEAQMGDSGRIITRMSGTEPKVRVMVECADDRKVKKILDSFKTYINSIQ